MSDSKKAAPNVDIARKAQLVYAFQRIFRQLAPILVREGVPYYEFRDILRLEYIAAAIRDGMPGWEDQGPPSAKALALRLGVPEAEIQRLVSDPEILKPPEATNTDLMAAVLTTWSTNTNFHGPYGLPLQLSLTSSTGASFTDLVHLVNPEADAADLMDEMISFGVVSRVGANRVRMTGREMFIPNPEHGNLFEHLGRGVEYLSETISHNIYANPDNKLFHRLVVSDRPIPKSKLEDFGRLVKSMYVDTLTQIDDWFVKVAEDNADSTEESVVVGIVVHEFRRMDAAEIVPATGHVLEPPAGHAPVWYSRPSEPENK